MQTTATTQAGATTDLLSGILNVQVRNEDKITEQDRLYCQTLENHFNFLAFKNTVQHRFLHIQNLTSQR